MADDPAVKRGKVTDLLPDAHNANRGTERGLALLENSLRKYGVGRGIVVDKNGRIIGGNKTVERLVDLGITDAILVQTDGNALVVTQRTDLDLDTDPAARELAWADNRVGQIDLDFDLDVLLVDLARDDLNLADLWRDDEIAQLVAEAGREAEGADDPGAQVDRAAELQATWGTARGQVWEIASKRTPGKAHRVMCGDSTDAGDVARLMGGEKANLIVTSPPYPGADMWGENEELPLDRISRLDELNRLLLLSAWNTVTDDGVVCWNIADVPFGNHGVVATTTTTTTACYEIGFLLRSIIIWDKGTPVLPPPAFMRRPAIAAIAHETILVLYRADWKPREKQCGIPDDDKQWLLKSVWPIATASAQVIGHKAPFPVELVRRCIVLWSIDADRVLDFCCGSGTTLVACEQTGRVGYGMEIAPEYVAVTLQRLSDMGLSPRLVDE